MSTGNEAARTVWLCDLTHTYQTVVANRMPLGIGMIAAYGRRKLGDGVSFRLFKFPQVLAEALEDGGAPLVVGFANYVWNQNLNLAVARRIKARHPETVVVFGGPNLPAEDNERLRFLAGCPWVDFYLPYEGEEAFFRLTERLLACQGDAGRVKKDPPPNAVFSDGARLVSGELLPRLNLAEVPSPYLTGLFDEFFGSLKPLVQMTRGCPFSCTYCTEGLSYWNRVSRRGAEEVAKELEYIAQRCDPGEDLFVADSNFGMYPQDLEYCRVLRGMQDRFSWPRYINVATGKNRKERVLEAARTVRGAIRLSSSVQSTDPVVLRNVRRQNISLQQLIDIGRAAGETGANTYSEFILALPGDRAAAHLEGLRTMIEAGLNKVRPYTLMLLEGTDLARRQSIDAYHMLIKHRVLPRCFGRYAFPGGDPIVTAEIERVCVGNRTLSLADYLECRKFHLTVELFFNDGIFADLYRILEDMGLSSYDFLMRIHAEASTDVLAAFYERFMQETRGELWGAPRDILDSFGQPGVFEEYERGDRGANLLFKYKTLGFSEFMDRIQHLAFNEARRLIAEAGAGSKRDMTWIDRFLEEVQRFHYCRTVDFLNTDMALEETFAFNICDYLEQKIPLRAVAAKEQTVRFEHDPEQRRIIDLNRNLFGSDTVGTSRVLSQVYIKKCFRKPSVVPGDARES